MAILVNNTYKKIIQAHIDFGGKQVIIFSDNYETKADRDLEKDIQNERYTFFYNVESDFEATERMIIAKIKELNNDSLEVENPTKFWEDNPILKEQADLLTEQREEYWNLRNKIDNEDINIEELKYLEKWEYLGLSQKLCTRIKRLKTEGISTPLMPDITISRLYDRLKEIIQAESIEDC